MQTNQLALVGVYFAYRCGFRCHVFDSCDVGQCAFFTHLQLTMGDLEHDYISVLGIFYDFFFVIRNL